MRRAIAERPAAIAGKAFSKLVAPSCLSASSGSGGFTTPGVPLVVVDTGVRAPAPAAPTEPSRPQPPKRPLPPSIHITFAAQRAPAVVARRVDGANVVVAGSMPARAPPAILDAERMRDAASAIVARQPGVTFNDMVEAARDGRVIPQAPIHQVWLVQQLAALVALLPAASFIGLCAVRSEAEVLRLGYERVARHVIERAKRPWKWSTIKDARNNWARWLVWLNRHDIEHDGVHFNAVDLGDFYAEVDGAARAKGPANKARAEARDKKAAALAEALGEPPPPLSKWQDGSCALEGVQRDHKFLVRHFSIELPVDLSGVTRTPNSLGRIRQPSPALSLEMIFRLEAYVNKAAAGASDVCPYTAAVAAGLLFCAFSCNRCDQANACAFLFVRVFGGSRFLHGALLLDKHPNPLKRRPRPFWMRVRGATGELWFDYLCSVLQGVASGCFVFRDFDSESGDPAQATCFLNNPLLGARLLHAIRCVVMRVCGMSWQLATLYALHSGRHFLLEVCGHRAVPPLKSVDVGRWSGSTAQDADLTPAERMSRKHQLQAGVMPDWYAPCAKIDRVCRILGEQMVAVDAAYAASRPDGLPLFGGFEILTRWPDKGGDDN